MEIKTLGNLKARKYSNMTKLQELKNEAGEAGTICEEPLMPYCGIRAMWTKQWRQIIFK